MFTLFAAFPEPEPGPVRAPLRPLPVLEPMLVLVPFALPLPLPLPFCLPSCLSASSSASSGRLNDTDTLTEVEDADGDRSCERVGERAVDVDEAGEATDDDGDDEADEAKEEDDGEGVEVTAAVDLAFGVPMSNRCVSQFCRLECRCPINTT